MGNDAPAGERHEERPSGGDHFRALVEVTSDWLWELDAQGRYTYSNPKVKELLGYEPHEVIGKTPFDFMHPDEARRVGAQFETIAAEHREFHELLNVNRHKDGHEVVLETSGVPIFDDDGRFAGFRGIDRDVTERFQAERRLRLADAAVQASAEGIIVADASGNITAVNPAWATMSGYPESAQLGRQPSMLTATEASRVRLWDLLNGAPKWSGEGTCRHRSGETFPVWMTLSAVRDEERVVTGFVALVSDMTERRAAEATIRFQASHDAVTQLANRTAFLGAVTRALADGMRNQERVAVLFVDLDGFKPVNDTYGHAVGDALLVQIAQRLSAALRISDVIARVGGDEFIGLFPDVGNRDSLSFLGERLLGVFNEPFEVMGHRLSLSGSIGLVVAPEDGNDQDSLLKAADEAMYRAKQAGKRRVQLSAVGPGRAA